jgi:hypothetical protein
MADLLRPASKSEAYRTELIDGVEIYGYEYLGAYVLYSSGSKEGIIGLINGRSEYPSRRAKPAPGYF